MRMSVSQLNRLVEWIIDDFYFMLSGFTIYNLSKKTAKFYRISEYKTGVINDPLGQTYTVSPVVTLLSLEICFVCQIFKSGDRHTDVRTNVRTDNMRENNKNYRPCRSKT